MSSALERYKWFCVGILVGMGITSWIAGHELWWLIASWAGLVALVPIPQDKTAQDNAGGEGS